MALRWLGSARRPVPLTIARWPTAPRTLGALLLLLGASGVVPSCRAAYPVTAESSVLSASGPFLPWHRVAVVDHDPGAFTEGLAFVGDRLFESDGLAGSSRISEISPATGALVRTVRWPDRLRPGGSAPFAEGLAAVGGRLLQLSWKDQTALTWDSTTLARGPDLSYAGEGWGLCHDGTALWRSDGTATIWRHDPSTLAPSGPALSVHMSAGAAVEKLNELECFKGHIYANVWQTTYVVRIDPSTGLVDGVLDFSSLVGESGASGSEDVLNGLAYRASTDAVYVTGKRWHRMFVIHIDG